MVFMAAPLLAMDMGTLFPLQQGYRMILSGTVLAADQPVAGAAVRIELHTSLDQTIKASTIANADGTYALHVDFDEQPLGQLDWKIFVRDNRATEKIVEGRRILDGDREITVKNTVEMPTHWLEVAMK